MTEPYPEYREIGVTEPLRQGDLLEAADPSASKWQRHLLVITADCDFAHDKHHGRVTCVPVLAAAEYLLEMQVPRIRDKFTAKLIKELRKVLSPGRGANISDERLKAWPCEVEPAEIAAALDLNGRNAEEAKAALESIRLANRPADNLDEAVELILESHLSAPHAKKRENIVRDITDWLKRPYSQPPGDALFLSSIAQNYDAGYFVYLRHLEQVWESEVGTGSTRSTIKYRRISRLHDRYIHALVQRFALVFMSIGLPADYEEIRDLHADLLGEKYK